MQVTNANSVLIIAENQISELAKHEHEWDKLILQLDNPYPTQTYTWMHAFFLFALKNTEKWICLFAYEDTRLVGVFPLILARRIGFVNFTIQVYHTPQNVFHTSHTDCVVLPEYEYLPEVFIQHLRKNYRCFPIVKIKSVNNHSTSLKYISSQKSVLAFKKRSLRVEDTIILSESFQEYLMGVDSQFRRGINRRQRKLSEKGDLNYNFDEKILSNMESLKLFSEIEHSGWKGKMGTSIIARPQDMDFYRSVTQKFKEKGWLEWNFLKLNNFVISGQLAFKIKNTIFLWKIAYLEEYSFFAPGNLLLYNLIDESIKRKDVNEVNFVTDSEWHKKWNITQRELFEIILLPGNSIFSYLIKIMIISAKYFSNMKSTMIKKFI